LQLSRGTRINLPCQYHCADGRRPLVQPESRPTAAGPSAEAGWAAVVLAPRARHLGRGTPVSWGVVGLGGADSASGRPRAL